MSQQVKESFAGVVRYLKAVPGMVTSTIPAWYLVLGISAVVGAFFSVLAVWLYKAYIDSTESAMYVQSEAENGD